MGCGAGKRFHDRSAGIYELEHMANRKTYVLGINAYDHDVSACLLRDGEIAYAIEKERLTREKHDTGFYQEVVDYVLSAEGIGLNDVDLVVRNSYVLPVDEMEQRLLHQYVSHYLGAEERDVALRSALFLSKSDKVRTISHHLAHAYSAFAASPFDEGAVMIVDGVGSYRCDVMAEDLVDGDGNPLARESESYYTFSGTELNPVKKVWLEPAKGFLSDEFYSMSGLGALYSRASMYIFGDWNKCGEVMGLAPYGRPDRIQPMIWLEDGKLIGPDWGADFDKPFIDDDDQSWEDSPHMQHWKDVAWRIQDDTEKVLLERARWLREKTGARNLVIAGGVALNCVANGRLMQESGFDNIWIQPAAGDNGIAIGCAYYGHVAVLKQPRSAPMRHAYLGRAYSDEEIGKVASAGRARFETLRETPDDIAEATAKLLAEGKIFGWFQGRSEFGPRALGSRSILADPRTAEMKDRLNAKVKFRQAFRPFAPIVLEERADEIFLGRGDSPYMLVAKDVHPDWRNRIPAITHVDGSARVQTVSRTTNPRLHELLTAFETLTGVPVLLNTSFNIRGEPIVETPEDAMRCFLSTGIDCLAIGDMLLRKSFAHRVIAPFAKAWTTARDAAMP